MANVLAWLTGREDRTQDPWPFQPQAELRAFNPPPSERFAHWVSGALGAGPGASLAHQRFAEGVPNVLSLFPPLGAGLSAADLLHAKAANDPMGVAAAALGMLPGARPAGKAVAKGATTTEDLIAQIATALEGKPLPGTTVTQYGKEMSSAFLQSTTGQTSQTTGFTKENPMKLGGGPQSIPINQISTPSPKETKAPDLLEAQKRYEEAIAPLFQNLPPRAVEQGYTTPAFRGLKIREGDVAPVHNFDKAEHQYATANPMLADMYADYLSKHPGWQVPSEAFDKGASVAPLLLDTSKYHYYDAAGAHWSTSAGNQRGIAQAREKGAPGVIVDNVWDEPNSTHALGTPSKIFITFPSGASTVKSRFAELFDPTSPNMLRNFAGLAAGGTGLGALLGSDRAQAAAPQRAQIVPPQPLSARINEIIDSLDWQDQWMGRMKLPLQRAAERRRKEQ